MCRLLCVRAPRPFPIRPHLERLAAIARASREYQGHGWGCAWVEGGEWRVYRHIEPIWDDPLEGFGEATLLLAHARSAFRDEGIVLDNNMPFFDGERAFAFNGELRGVRIRERGRIGAEKVFRLIARLDQGDPGAALERAVAVIERRTRYLRALNLVLALRDRALVYSRFAEDPDYFRLHRTSRDRAAIVCSAPFPGEGGWQPVANGTGFEL